jgi:hypothetical protein
VIVDPPLLQITNVEAVTDVAEGTVYNAVKVVALGLL